MQHIVIIENIELKQLPDDGWEATYSMGHLMYNGIGHTQYEAIGRLIENIRKSQV
jgi:hypothetical protein